MGMPLMETMSGQAFMPAARARRPASRSLLALLLAVLATLASSTAANAVTLPVLGSASPEGVGAPAEPGVLRSVARTATGQPASGAPLATDTVKQASSLLAPGASSTGAAPGGEGGAHALTAAAAGSAQGF